MPESSRRNRSRRSRHSPNRVRGSSDTGQDSGGSRPRIRPRTWKKIRRWSVYGAALTVAVLVIGSFIIGPLAGSGGHGGGGGGGTSGTGAAVGEQIALLAAIHIPEGDSYDRYNSSPPTSGRHWGTGWARCGIYDNEDDVPDERIVHNMEHGQVIISYNLTDETEIERLENIAKDLPSRRRQMIMRPYTGITPGEVAITSWGWLDRFDGVQEDRIREFYDAHVNNGLESVSCLQGG